VELLRVYKPDFPLVQEVDKQLAETRAAILAAQKTPLLEETTDRDPTYEWLRAELTRAKSELVTLEAQAQATRRNLGICREKAGQLERKELIYQDLVRDAKLAEQNYMVYFRKQEEARITDALDRQRIVNVAIAEAATVPFLPSGPSRSLLLLLVGVVGGLVSGALAFAADHWDPSFHTPQEVESYLNIPVAAAIPKGPR
jgi:uncharacterized protein involved in exopolysaccharide biosynthesis